MAIIQPVKAQGDFWVERAPMPSPSAYVQAVTVNGEIYAFTPTSTYMYDPSSNTWTVKAPMPTEEYGFAAAAYQNTIYIIGGCSAFDESGFPINCTGLNQAYDTSTNTWQVKEPMPTARAYLQAGVVGGKIYLIDGAPSNNGNGLGSYIDVNEVYNPANDSWTTAASMGLQGDDLGIDQYASTVLDNKVYVIGGFFNYQVLVDEGGARYYDPESNNWTAIKSSPYWIGGAGAAATSGTLAPKNIYVEGGTFPGEENSFFNEIYNPETGNWSYGAPLPTTRCFCGVAVVSDAIYVIGGTTFPSSGGAYSPAGVVGSLPSAVNEEYFPLGYQGPMPSPPPPTVSPTTSPTPRPTATPNPPLTRVITISNGSTVHLYVGGNITDSQMSSVSFSADQSTATTTLNFNMTGTIGNTVSGFLLIPGSAISYGTTPTVYVDNQVDPDQNFTELDNNYYISYIINFSTSKAANVSILFTTPPFTSPSAPEFPALILLPIFLAATLLSIVYVKRRITRK
jgi:N-acetylneuraminic acid mutarotase